MSKIVSYILGIVTGVIISAGVLFVYSKTLHHTTETEQESDGISMFEGRGQAMSESSFKIFQTIDDKHALASGITDENYGWYMGITVMILGDENDHFYDDQIIKRSSGKKFYQVGTYKYTTRTQECKTVPIVALLSSK